MSTHPQLRFRFFNGLKNARHLLLSVRALPCLILTNA